MQVFLNEESLKPDLTKGPTFIDKTEKYFLIRQQHKQDT